MPFGPHIFALKIQKKLERLFPGQKWQKLPLVVPAFMKTTFRVFSLKYIFDAYERLQKAKRNLYLKFIGGNS